MLDRLGVTRDRSLRWGVLLGQFFSAQTLNQALGLLAGLLLVRFMPIEEFALYTLAFSVITFFAFVTDLGVGSSLVHFFHQSRSGHDLDYPAHVWAVLSLRALAFALGSVVVAVVFPALASRDGFAGRGIPWITLGIVLCVGFQIVSSVRILLLRLAERFGASYLAELAGASVRLLGVALMLWADLLLALVGVLVASASALAVAVIAPGESLGRPERPALPVARKRVLRYLLPTLPSALYFSIQAPLVVWLATYFGGTTNLAEVGALTRLGLIFGVFNTLVGAVFVPKLAHVTDDRTYLVRYLQYSGFLAAVAACFLLAAAAFPDELLWIIGPNYSGLHHELLLTVGTAGISLLTALAVGVTMTRSWTRWNIGILVLHVSAQAVLVATLPLATTQGVLTFGLLSAAVGFTLQSSNNFIGFRRPALVQWS